MKKLIVVLLLVSMASIASANLLTNPGFETEAVVGNWWDAADWYEGTYGGVVWRNEWYSRSGDASMIVHRNGEEVVAYTEISQNVAGHTIASDDVFTVSAWVAPIGDTTAQSGILYLYSNDGVTNTLLDEVAFPALTGNPWWTEVTLEVDIADHPYAIGQTPFVRMWLQVDGTTADNQLLVDDVSLTVVPEPATMVMLGLGGLALIRRKMA